MTDETPEVTPDSGTPDSGMVAIEDASDEDLESFLKGDHQPAETVAAPPAEPQPEVQAQPEAAPTPAENTVPQRTPQQVETELREQLRQKELFIQRQANALGETRKQLRAALAEREQTLDEAFLESPSKGLIQHQQVQELKEKLQTVDAQEEQLKQAFQAQQALARWIKPGEVTLEDTVRSLRDDGVPEDFISHYQQNPLTSLTPDGLVHLAKRAKAEGLLRKAIPIIQGLIAERDKLRAAPKQMLEKVSQAARQTPMMTAASGGGSQTATNVNPTSMSDAEIEAILAQSGIKV